MQAHVFFHTVRWEKAMEQHYIQFQDVTKSNSSTTVFSDTGVQTSLQMKTKDGHHHLPLRYAKGY